MTHYDQPPEEAIALIKGIIEDFHPDLEEAGVTVDAIMAYNNKGFAVKAGGYPESAEAKFLTAQLGGYLRENANLLDGNNIIVKEAATAAGIYTEVFASNP